MAKSTNPLEELTTISELIDRLSIENIRLWNLKDEVMALRKELDLGVTKERELEINKILATKAFADVDIVKKRSVVKRAIDETLVRVIEQVKKGKKVSVTNEHKSYGK